MKNYLLLIALFTLAPIVLIAGHVIYTVHKEKREIARLRKKYPQAIIMPIKKKKSEDLHPAVMIAALLTILYLVNQIADKYSM